MHLPADHRSAALVQQQMPQEAQTREWRPHRLKPAGTAAAAWECPIKSTLAIRKTMHQPAQARLTIRMASTVPESPCIVVTRREADHASANRNDSHSESPFIQRACRGGHDSP